jgi:hypothetical protein
MPQSQFRVAIVIIGRCIGTATSGLEGRHADITSAYRQGFADGVFDPQDGPTSGLAGRNRAHADRPALGFSKGRCPREDVGQLDLSI